MDEQYKKICDCEDWHNHAETIVEQALFCYTYPLGPRYEGPMFKFCPWCGFKLRNK